MPSVSNTAILIALLAVTSVLMLGLFNMMRGGSASRAQSLMRWRVGLQFLAVVVMMGIVWWQSF
jgi:Hypoxia induced protein conserved region